MSGLFIDRRRIPHDGSRRVVISGAYIRGSLHITGPHAAADALASAVIAGRARREQAEQAAKEGT